MWLSAVIDKLASTGKTLTWRQIVRLHPMHDVLDEEWNRPIEPDNLMEVLDATSNLGSWEKVRLLNAAGGTGLDAFVQPKLASWMDEGMYARWVLSELASPEELLAQVRPLVAPSIARRLAHAVRVAM
jgi:hypothetical protein